MRTSLTWPVERVFKDFFNPVTLRTTEHTGGAFGEGEYHYCERSLLSCQNIGKGAGCDEIRPEMFQAFNRKLFG